MAKVIELSILVSISKNQTKTRLDFWIWNKNWNLVILIRRIRPGTMFPVLFRCGTRTGTEIFEKKKFNWGLTRGYPEINHWFWSGLELTRQKWLEQNQLWVWFWKPKLKPESYYFFVGEELDPNLVHLCLEVLVSSWNKLISFTVLISFS
jgi:hypothetical protein